MVGGSRTVELRGMLLVEHTRTFKHPQKDVIQYNPFSSNPYGTVPPVFPQPYEHRALTVGRFGNPGELDPTRLRAHVPDTLLRCSALRSTGRVRAGRCPTNRGCGATVRIQALAIPHVLEPRFGLQ
jgi:hypothetical protein